MNIGSRVFYRLTDEDAEAVNRRHSDAVTNAPENLRLRTGFQWHIGDKVEAGQLLPADVVRCYSVKELGHDPYGATDPHPGDFKLFSGVADIRVLLPGNDVLYVHHAREDTSPTGSLEMGHGLTTLPEPGKFTTAVPAPLLG